MYDEDDLNEAVRHGALSAAAVADFRAFMARRRAGAVADDEDFRLLTGFNDVFVSIALVIFVGAMCLLLALVSHLAAAGGVAAASWGLAEYFTRRRRMALPSILLLGSFSGAMAALPLLVMAARGKGTDDPAALVVAAGLAVGCLAALGHWFRFRVPITVAVLCGTGLGAVVVVLLAAAPGLKDWLLPLALACGLILFAAALWWDASDPARTTRRSDVAFWLHLLAAPAIVHPIFGMIGLFGDDAGPAQSVLAIAVYAVFGVVALIVDRRAIMVSALAYVLYAISSLLPANASSSTSMALTGLIIGSALLMMSVWWRALRGVLVRALPYEMREVLPRA